MGHHTFRRRKHSRRTLKQRGGGKFTTQQIDYMGDTYSNLIDAVNKFKRLESKEFNDRLGDTTSTKEMQRFSKPNVELMKSNPKNVKEEDLFATLYQDSIVSTQMYIGELCRQLTKTKKYLDSLPTYGNIPVDGRKPPGEQPLP